MSATTAPPAKTTADVRTLVASGLVAMGTGRREAVDAATGVYTVLYDWRPLRRRDRRIRREWLDLYSDAFHYLNREDAP